MKLTIDYEPTPKSSPRTRTINGRVLTYYNPRTIEAMVDIRAIINSMKLKPFPKHIPLKLDVTFYRQKSVWLPKRETKPFRKPDLDNFLKLCLDTITTTIIPDDAQITCINARKCWSPNNHGYIDIELTKDN